MSALDVTSRVWGALRWPVGMGIASYRVLRRIDVVRSPKARRGAEADPIERDVPGDPEQVQPRAAGAAPSARRRYRLRGTGARLSPSSSWPRSRPTPTWPRPSRWPGT